MSLAVQGHVDVDPAMHDLGFERLAGVVGDDSVAECPTILIACPRCTLRAIHRYCHAL